MTDTIVYQWCRTSDNGEVLLTMIPHPGIDLHQSWDYSEETITVTEDPQYL